MFEYQGSEGDEVFPLLPKANQPLTISTTPQNTSRALVLWPSPMGHDILTMSTYVNFFWIVMRMSSDGIDPGMPFLTNHTCILCQEGKGLTTGPNTEEAVITAAETVFEYVNLNRSETHRLFILGFSFGGAIAIQLPAHHQRADPCSLN